MSSYTIGPKSIVGFKCEPQRSVNPRNERVHMLRIRFEHGDATSRLCLTLWRDTCGRRIAGRAVCPMASPYDPCHIDRTVVGDDKDVELLIVLGCCSNAGTFRRQTGRRDGDRASIASRSISPPTAADYPCHMDSAVVANEKCIELVGALFGNGDGRTRRSKIGWRNCRRSSYAWRAIRPTAGADDPCYMSSTIVSHNKGVKLIVVLFDRGYACTRRCEICWGYAGG